MREEVMALVIEIFTIFLGLYLASAVLLRLMSFSSKHREAAASATAAAAKLPEGSMGWPLIGETLSFLSPHRSNSPGTFLLEHCSRYGKVFRSHLFGSPTIVSCDLEFNVFILQNEEKLFRASYPKAMHGILGKNSLLVVSGERHKKLRNVAISFISTTKSTADFHRCMEEMTVAMMESWRGLKEVPFNKEAKEFTLNLMMKALLSIKPGDGRGSRILEAFMTYMKGFISLPLNYPGSPYAMAVKARARLSSTVKEIIEERKSSASVDGSDHTKSGGRGGDFLDVIMGTAEGLSQTAPLGLTEEEQVSTVLDLLLGGYETTATVMSLIVYFLAHHPVVLQTLKEEHRAIRQSKEDGEPLNWEDYKQMGFTYDVICEALRYGNVVKFVHREAIQDVEFKGLRIPAGWKVLPVFTGQHLDPDLHANPMEFDPWRWNNDKGTKKKVTPFGGGARLCPGHGLACVELAFFLHHLVLNYRWKTRGDELALAHPYVEFKRGLILEIEPIL